MEMMVFGRKGDIVVLVSLFCWSCGELFQTGCLTLLPLFQLPSGRRVHSCLSTPGGNAQSGYGWQLDHKPSQEVHLDLQL